MNAENLTPTRNTIHAAAIAALDCAGILLSHITSTAANVSIDLDKERAAQVAGLRTDLSTLPSGSIKASLDAIGIHGAAAVAASMPLDADLHPLDSELAIEIRAMFLAHWNMDATQADARMAQFNYCHAIAALPVPAPGAIGSAFGGGTYAGIIRGVNGAPDEHLVLLDGEAEKVTWDAAGGWAASQGGELPTRAEQRLLQANLPTQFKPDWYWSGEQAGPSTAWDSGFRQWPPEHHQPLVRGSRPRRPQISNLILYPFQPEIRDDSRQHPAPGSYRARARAPRQPGAFKLGAAQRRWRDLQPGQWPRPAYRAGVGGTARFGLHARGSGTHGVCAGTNRRHTRSKHGLRADGRGNARNHQPDAPAAR